MPIDIDQSHYADGTASISSGTTTVTGQGTTWLGAIRPGDLFGTQFGLSIRILSIESNTELTLAYPWQGPSQTEGAYEIQRTPYDLGYHQATEELLLLLGGGNLEAFAGIEGANGRIPYFTGAGTMSYLTQEDLVSGVAFDVQVDTLPERAAYDGEPEGFAVLVSDTGDGRAALYTRVGPSGWSDPAYITGPAISLDVGTVTPVAFDDDPDVTITALGDGEYELNFDLPVAADFTVGSTTTVAPGEPAAVTVTPTATGYELDFEIPSGGLRYLGDYDGGTNYVPGDVVSDDGSSWVAIDDTTGNAPPTYPPTESNAWWRLLAAKGDTGSISGVTAFWQNRLESDTDAAEARTGLGLGSAAVEDAGVFAAAALFPTIGPGDAGKQLYVTNEEDGYRLDDPTGTAATVTFDNTEAEIPDDPENVQEALEAIVPVRRELVAPNIRPTIPITPLEYGAIFDGVTDDSAAVQAAAEAAIAAGVALFLPPGVGLVGDISTVGPLEIIGAPGASLRLASGSDFLWSFDGDGGLVRLNGLSLDGNDVTGMTRLCGFANGQAELLHCKAFDYNGTLSGAGREPFTFHTTLDRSKVLGGEYFNMLCANVLSIRNHRGIVDGAYFHDLSFHGIRFGLFSGDPGSSVRSGQVVNCNFWGLSQGGGGTAPEDAGGSAVLLELGSNSIIVAHNYVRGARQVCKADESANHLIIDNYGDTPAGLLAGGTGVQIVNASNCVVRGNTLNGYDMGVNVTNSSSRVAVQNNWIFGATDVGIRCATSEAMITDNLIRNSANYGILLTGNSANSVVRSNLVRSSTGTPINDGGTGNTVAGNVT